MTIQLEPKRYIPFRKHDIIEMCLSGTELDAGKAVLILKSTMRCKNLCDYNLSQSGTVITAQ